jgi:enoyl-CoA hydratase/carnithine racemase
MAALTRERAEVFISALRDLCNALRHFPVPVIARMPGWCLGGGLELALACDIRIAADNAQLGMPEVKVGIPSVIHAALMPRLIGNARAAWLLLTGEIADAAESLAAGLVSRVVPLADLDVEVSRVASLLASFGPQVVRQQKRLLRGGKKRRSTCRSTTAWRSSAAPLTRASRSITWPPS